MHTLTVRFLISIHILFECLPQIVFDRDVNHAHQLDKMLANSKPVSLVICFSIVSGCQTDFCNDVLFQTLYLTLFSSGRFH